MQRVDHVHRVPEHRDDPRIRVEGMDVPDGFRRAEVVHRGLADGEMVRRPGLEQLTIGFERLDARVPAEVLREEVRLLQFGHEDVRMGTEILVQRGRPALGRAYDEEVRYFTQSWLRAGAVAGALQSKEAPASPRMMNAHR